MISTYRKTDIWSANIDKIPTYQYWRHITLFSTYRPTSSYNQHVDISTEVDPISQRYNEL